MTCRVRAARPERVHAADRAQGRRDRVESSRFRAAAVRRRLSVARAAAASDLHAAQARRCLLTHRKLAMWTFATLAGLALVAIWPDVRRYYRIHGM